MVAASRITSNPVAEAFSPAADAIAWHQPEAVTHLLREIEAGRPWCDALLEAVGLWRMTHEVVDGQEYVYLISGEAFDWLALAGRLLAEAPDAVPAEDRERLLFRGEFPEYVTPGRFQEALGVAKYRAHLNYYYGVIVEEALWFAVEREVNKERGVRGLHHGLGVHDLVTQRLYGAGQDDLIRNFRRAQGRKVSVKFSLADWKEFTYWLFKQRLARCDSARIASDTRKGLRMLQELRDEAGDGPLVRNAAAPSPLP